MLKGVSSLLSPDLLYVMAQMGHSDEIILADALFPAYSVNSKVLRMDGVEIPALLHAMMPHFPIDTYVKDSVFMVEPPMGDAEDPELPQKYRAIIDQYCPEAPATMFTPDRQEFYQRASKAFCVVVTGSVVKYGNLLLKKGVY
ncbi:RbsD/FucU family protein [Cohaesibacter celericrescens]|uniref:Fucose isomerase n=1 Tax=Cohaesibacter celericrescens TaxID=2067669 RepID=A0A2N5XV72_9HYPH|nr:RbsD/FucU domain-containing protein [Cohaesibacter celericrescens]PLW78318.1 fucose isomerase [Cohaesibacter celericrescens]